MTKTAGADVATRAIATRRGLLGAGIADAAAVLVAGRAASATTPPGPRLDGADLALLTFLQSLELAARDLYQAAVAAGAVEPLFALLADQHQAYAQGIAAFTGTSADTRDDAVFAELEPAFAASDVVAVATAGYDLESAIVATHTDALANLDNVDGAKLVASMLAMEARHCAVLADVSGHADDLDALLVSSAEPIAAEGRP